MGVRLRRFVLEELERPGGRERISGVNHGSRILAFLTHTLIEHEQASLALLENIREQERLEEQLAARGARPRPVTPERLVPEQRALFEEGGRLAEVVHLRTETFYALARVLLDRLAEAFERYFGAANGIAMRRHADDEPIRTAGM
jgi:hypothetical protein